MEKLSWSGLSSMSFASIQGARHMPLVHFRRVGVHTEKIHRLRLPLALLNFIWQGGQEGSFQEPAREESPASSSKGNHWILMSETHLVWSSNHNLKRKQPRLESEESLPCEHSRHAHVDTGAWRRNGLRWTTSHTLSRTRRPLSPGAST